jgi:hypothetical protein
LLCESKGLAPQRTDAVVVLPAYEYLNEHGFSRLRRKGGSTAIFAMHPASTADGRFRLAKTQTFKLRRFAAGDSAAGEQDNHPQK